MLIMQAIVETLFDTVYLFSVITIGILMIRKSKGNRQFTMFGIMAVLLGSGDAFHLVPRAVALCTTGLENFTVQMGLGKWITSITMTILKSSPPQNLQQVVAIFQDNQLIYFTEVLIFNFFPSDFYIAKIISPSAVYPLYVLHNNQPHSVPLSHHIHTGIL